MFGKTIFKPAVFYWRKDKCDQIFKIIIERVSLNKCFVWILEFGDNIML